MKRPAKGIISKPLLQKVTYEILPLLLIKQGSFRYCWYYWVKLYPICHLFSLWADQFLLAPTQILETGRTITLNQFQGFFLKKFLLTLELWLIRLGAESNVILSFSRKKYRIRFLTLNTFNPFSKNLMRRELGKNLTLFGFSAKVSGHQ